MKRYLLWLTLCAVVSCKPNDPQLITAPSEMFVGFGGGEIYQNGGNLLYGKGFLGQTAHFVNENTILFPEQTWDANHYIKIYKNGTPIYEEKNGSRRTVHGVYAFGEDWYAVGYELSDKCRVANDGFCIDFIDCNNTPVLWKNGVRQYLPTPDNKDGVAHQIVVTATDVFVTGTLREGKGLLWKNGALITLPNARSFRDIQVDGQDVYLFGLTEDYKYQVWKNGIPKDMSKLFPSKTPSISGFFVENGDIYFSECEQKNKIDWKLSWWKNGVKNTFHETQTENVSLNDIFVKNGQVYMVGVEATPDCRGAARIWSSGPIASILTPANDCAYPEWIYVR